MTKKLSVDELLVRLSKISAIAFDVDGVLTDGRLYCFGGDGNLIRRYHVRDGRGMFDAMKLGLKIFVVSHADDELVARRYKKMGVDRVVSTDRRPKDQIVSDILDEFSLGWDEIAFMGDDTNDLPVMNKEEVLAVCPADAYEAVQHISDYVVPNDGGNGAARHICDMWIMSRGLTGFPIHKQGTKQ